MANNQCDICRKCLLAHSGQIRCTSCSNAYHLNCITLDSRELVKKSKDYVYGIWVYNILGIWKGYYRVKKSLVSCTKPWTEARNIQTYIPTLILKCEPKSGPSCRRQVVHPRPQTPQGESVAKPETPLLIILSIACKWGPCQHVQSVIRKAKSVDKNILGRWLKTETASQT